MLPTARVVYRIFGIATDMKDRIQLEQLLEYSGWLKTMARSLVLDDARAHDVMQQTWLAALKTPPRSMTAARSWLSKVLRNFAFNTHREERSRRLREERVALPEKTAATPDELLQRVELQREIADAVTQLDEPYRTVVVLRFFEELTATEIARRQNIPLTTVCSRLDKALAQLRTKLDRRFGGDRRVWSLVLLPLVRPQEVAAAAGAAAATTTLPGLLVMKGFAMKALGKIATVILSIVLAGSLLTICGILPESFFSSIFGDPPMEVAFRPIVFDHASGPDRSPLDEPDLRKEAVIPYTLIPNGTGADDQSVSNHSQIEARVVDSSGLPLAGAALREVSMQGPGHTALAGEDGSVRLELEVTGDVRGAHIEVALTGYVSYVETVRLEAGRTIPLGTIEMRPGGIIRGQVVDRDGCGVAGAIITTEDEQTSTREMEMWRFNPPRLRFPVVRSDGYGFFALTGLPGGFTRLWVRAEGKRPTFTVPVEVREGHESYGVEIVLPALDQENRVCGKVIDPSGSPVSSARLEYALRPKNEGMFFRGRNVAKKDGSFEYQLEADCSLSVTAFDPQGRYGPAAIERVDPGDLNLILRLVDIRRIELQVLDELGVRVDKFRFQILSAAEEFELESGESGESIESGLGSDPIAVYHEPGTDYLVRITTPAYRINTADPFGSNDVAERLEVRLTPLPGLHGVVRIAAGPLEGARVSLHRLTPEGRTITNCGFRCRLDPKVLDEAESDAAGVFVVTPREEGRYVVRIERDGLAPAEAGPFTLTPGLQTEPIEVCMSQGGAIEGQVVILPVGEDPTGTIVAIHRGDGFPCTVRADGDGFFRCTALLPGPWRVEECDEEIWRDDLCYGPTQIPFENEVQWNCEVFEGRTTRFDLNLADAGAYRLEGILTMDGRPLEGWIAWLCPLDAVFFDNSGQWPTATVDPDGCFELSSSEPGDHRLVIKNAASAREHVFFDDIYLGGSITPWRCDLTCGSVLIDGLKPSARDSFGLVYLGEGEISYMSRVLPDANGECRLKPVPAGTGRLVCPTMESTNPDDWQVVETVQVSHGSEIRIEMP